jgi:hypothetical protein
LAKYKKAEIKLMIHLSWALCKKIYKTVRYKRSFLNKVPGTFSFNIERLKEFMLGSMKNKIVTRMIEMLPQGGSYTGISINRVKHMTFIETGKVDHDGEITIFG